ncbi:glycosyltransferase [Acidisphaera sp. S103]|uniref:glycosyltransferase family 2 protein n=1 Tax=Acidisphaera sp. S103 TaxID=1747223 RepID=UPI00131E8459|nr:glycosyltransferase family 2 protein [Acidisphaera sp. S103]
MIPAFIPDGNLTDRIIGVAMRVHGRLSPFPLASRGNAEVPVVLRARRITFDGVRRLWMMLPRRWMPWVFSGLFCVAACLPNASRSRVRGLLARLRAASANMEQDYSSWIRLYEQAGVKTSRKMAARMASLVDPPLISILMPVVNPSLDHLRQAIRSVQNQIYGRWELCIVDGSPRDSSVAALLRQTQAGDFRVKLIRGESADDVSVACNAAVALASGSFIALLGHDDQISPHALCEVVVRIVAHPAPDIVYSDQDSIDDTGRRSMPYFKPDWDLGLMLGQNLIGCLGVFRRGLVEQIGGFRAGLEGNQDYDLALRLVEHIAPDRIQHIPKVLYHRRLGVQDSPFSRHDRKQYPSNDQRAVREFLSRNIPDAQLESTSADSVWNRVIYPIPSPEPLVSVVIPSRNHADLLARAAGGLLDRTDYRSLEILIVDNGSDEPVAQALLERLALDNRIRILRCPGPFNYAALNNQAVREAGGELILLLNNDIDVINPGWLREMISHAIRPGIGAVGAKLLYPNGTIQHGGLTINAFSVADRQYLGKPRDDSGYFGHLKLVRSVTAVTAACLLVRREAYLEVGGLNEVSLAVAFNDVDFCLKLAERGYRNVWTPHAELYHLESASRGADHTAVKFARLQREIAFMRQRWGHWLDHDPRWNPNLALLSTEIALAFPPRDNLGPTPKGALASIGGLPIPQAGCEMWRHATAGYQTSPRLEALASATADVARPGRH